MRHKSNYNAFRKPVNGFTLIELLVVIAIIALLLSILMPSLKKVKKTAQAVICRTNLRSWGTCFSLYAADNDGRNGKTDWDGDEGGYFGLLRPYYEDLDKLRYCPSAKTPHINPSETREEGQTFKTWYQRPGSRPWMPADDPSGMGSYGNNMWSRTADPVNWEGMDKEHANKYISISSGESSEVPVLMDARWQNLRPFLQNVVLPTASKPFNYTIDTEWDTIKTVTMNRHGNGININFLDTSTRQVDVKDLIYLKWYKGFNFNVGAVGPITDWENISRYLDDDK